MVSITITALVAVLNAALPILPADVAQECEDHVSAYRIVQGHELVFSCESWAWFPAEQYDALHDGNIMHEIVQGEYRAQVVQHD